MSTVFKKNLSEKEKIEKERLDMKNEDRHKIFDKIYKKMLQDARKRGDL